MNKLTRKILFSIAGLALASSVHAATHWDFTCPSNDCAPGSPYSPGNTLSYSSTEAGGAAATASAWANTVGSANTTIESAYLGAYSGGLGVTNRDASAGDTGEGASPQHAIDNQNRYDSVLLSFANAVKLSQVKIGWASNDSDITVLAWTGAGAASLNGLSYSNLIANGWSLVGHYANLLAGSDTAINEAGIASSYWLIGAYNPTVGSSQGWTTGQDYLKLAGVTGQAGNQVSEPQVLMLLLFAAGAAFYTRRRT